MHYLFHSTPTCTFKTRTQTITKINQPVSTPGPADYQVKKPLAQPQTISQITEQRNLYHQKNDNPGPGAYQTKSYIEEGPKKSLSARLPNVTKQTPSPQDYMTERVKVQYKAPVYTLGKRSKSTRDIDFDHNSYKPAPSNYPTKDSFKVHNGTFMGSSNRKDLTQTEKTPAPNMYQTAPASDFAAVTNPHYKFGEQFRKTSFNKAQNTPSPNIYTIASFIDQNLSKKKGFSCRSKVTNLASVELSKVPAPGQYEMNFSNKNTAPRCSVSIDKRNTFMDDMQKFKTEYPGPGTHEPRFAGTKYRSMSVSKFSKSPRKPLDENQKTPGPVEYKHEKIKVLNSAPKYSTSLKANLNQFLLANPQHPGPGNYDPKLELVKQRTLVSEVPKQKRPDFEHLRHTPAPGFYNIRGKQQGPTWKFSSEKRTAFTDHKNQAKHGVHYNLQAKVVDPPTYMNVNSKLKFQDKSMGNTGLSHK